MGLSGIGLGGAAKKLLESGAKTRRKWWRGMPVDPPKWAADDLRRGANIPKLVSMLKPPARTDP
jgi:hypothetical protein